MMADSDDKVEGSVAGKYYVDSNCIDCDVCRTTAPNNFEANEDEGFSFVSKQPANDEEEEQCAEALESCPVEAIGDDGDE
jgi:ferredoxin